MPYRNWGIKLVISGILMTLARKTLSAIARRPRFQPMIVAVLILVFLFQITLWYRWSDTHLPICGFGTAKSVDSALRTAAQFPQIPFWFAIQDQHVDHPQVIDGQVHLLPISRRAGYADGWKMAVEYARHQTWFRCEWFFAVEDDLLWDVTHTGMRYLNQKKWWNKWLFNEDVEPSEVLMSVLNEYQPAVMVFSRPPRGVEPTRALAEMNAEYHGEIVQPATGFDGGNLVFHHSVIDFFIPVWLGRDAKPSFNLQQLFHNLLIPFMFRGNAIRLNGLKLIGSLAKEPQVESKASKAYIERAIKCPDGRWGASLGPSDVTWRPKRGQPPYEYNDLVLLSTIFNISHSAIRDHPILNRRLYSPTQIDDIQLFSDAFLASHLACTEEAPKVLRQRARELVVDLVL